jgi:hypothetical protein
MMAYSQPQRIADEPFDGHDVPADIILRSKDSVDFYVHKTVLSIVSPVFRDMFSFPQPLSRQNDAPSVIDISEDSKTVNYLLLLSYPLQGPIVDIDDFRDIADVLEAARKYQIERVTFLLKPKLSAFTRSQPLRAYALASRLHFEEEAKASAEFWRRRCPLLYSKPTVDLDSIKFPDWDETVAATSYISEMAEVSAGVYFRLLRFIRTGDAQNFTLHDPTDFTASAPTEMITTPDLYPSDLEKPDIILQSSEGCDFRVHERIISMASPRLLDKEWTAKDDFRVFKVFENARTLGTLLWLCYPFCDPEAMDIDVADSVLRAAIKHQVPKVVVLMKKRYRKEIKDNPLRVYFAAIRLGWKEEAQEAARRLAMMPVEEIYSPEMESMPASVYHHLLKYCHDHRSRFAHLCQKYTRSRTDSGASATPWEYLNEGAPLWWYIHQNEGNLLPFIASPIVQRELGYTRHSSYSNGFAIQNARGIVCESADFAAELENALSEVSCDYRENVNRQFSELSCRLDWTTKSLNRVPENITQKIRDSTWLYDVGSIFPTRIGI